MFRAPLDRGKRAILLRRDSRFHVVYFLFFLNLHGEKLSGNPRIQGDDRICDYIDAPIFESHIAMNPVGSLHF